MIFTDAAEGHAWVSAASCYTKEAGCERPMLHEPEHVKVCVGGKQVGARGAGGERLAWRPGARQSLGLIEMLYILIMLVVVVAKPTRFYSWNWYILSYAKHNEAKQK